MLLLSVPVSFSTSIVQEAGFHMGGGGGGGGGWNFPPSPEILKLSMVINVLSQVLNNNLVPDCVRSNLRECKLKIFQGGGHGHAPRPT